MVGIGKKGRCHGQGIVGIWQRELGHLSPRNFAHRVGASEDLVMRLGIHRKLNRHRGCVNTVSFNANGDILVSGSDDRMVILWDWDTGKVKLSFHSSHSNNVFQARFMPYTNDQTMVTCAADGEVRHVQIGEGGKVATSMLAQHEGRAHKLAIEPGSSHIFYSCGEDGLVQHFDLRTKSATKLFVCRSFQDKSAYMPIIHLNAIAIDPRNANHFAVGGTGEYAQLYDIRMYKWDGSSDFGQPTNCFCPSHLVGDNQVAITGLAFSDQSELLVSYSDEFIYLFSKDQGCRSHPSQPSGDDPNLGTGSPSPAADDQSEIKVYKGHVNCDTVKGVNFFGPNCEYVVSGSDCGRIFIWRKRDGELLRVMEGDRHVVNCIELHPYSTTIASSGIEHDIKIWTPNALERAPPINVDEVLKADGFCFDDSDYDIDDDDTDDDDDDDDMNYDDDDADNDDDGDDNDGSQLKQHKRKARFCRFAFPEQLIAQILAQQTRRSSPGSSTERSELVDLLMNYADNDDGSSDDDHEDDNDDDGGEGNTSDNPGDCLVG